MRRFSNSFERQFEHNPYTENTQAQEVAARYCVSLGFPEPQATPYVQVNPVVAKEIASVYALTPNSPHDPAVQAAYAALVNEVDAQYAILPVEIFPVDTQSYPYKNSTEMMDDVMHNYRLAVFDGGDDHAILTREQNFKFRAVHDFFGHCQKGLAFGPRGEENAWVEHSKMFSPQARQAMTTETRGQNSWVNAGPFSNLPVAERPYAAQKVFILPSRFLTRPELDAAYRDFPGFYESYRTVAANPGVKFTKPSFGQHMIKPRAGGPSVYQGTFFDIEKPKLPRKKKVVTWCFREEHVERLKYYFELYDRQGFDWYDTTYPAIVEFFRGDVERANLFVYLLAATSPLTNIRENIQRALHALRVGEQFGNSVQVFKENIPFEAHRMNVIRAFRGEPLSGPKVTNFAKNIFGPDFRTATGEVAFPDAADAVTVDRWVWRAVNGVCNEEKLKVTDDAPTEPQFRCVENAIKKLAYEAGVQPRQYQAAVWVAIKLKCGSATDTANPFQTELTAVARRVNEQGRFDFDFDPEYTSFEQGLDAVVFHENQDDPLTELEDRILDSGDGEYVLRGQE
jgi:hypothetical protein